MNPIPIMRVTYPDITISQWKARQLRGFFSQTDRDDPVLHQHVAGGGVAYRYPLVQYKVIRQHPMIVAAGEGIRHIHPHVMAHDTLLLDGETYPCGQRRIELGAEELQVCARPIRYRFLSPWFGLNQANFARYTALARQEDRTELLSRILAGNILSMAKGLGITVEGRLAVTPRLRERRDRFKGETILSFYGEFEVNARLPDYLALGKSVSRGYGTYVRLPEGKTPPPYN